MILYFADIDMPYVCVFDIEHDTGDLFQFSAILFKKVGEYLYQIYKNINFYVKQKQFSPFIESFSHIDLKFVNDYGISKNEISDILEKFFGNIDLNEIIFVSHGVLQDLLILKNNGLNLSISNTLCTYEMSKQILDRNNHLSLDDICYECGYINPYSHNAYGDALSTAVILSFLLKKSKESKDEDTKFRR